MKQGRRKTPSQKKFRKKVFSYYQYWIVYFTERYEDQSEKDFVTFIKAKSYDLAKTILTRRVKESDSKISLKAVVGYLLHSEYRNTQTGQRLSLKDWDNIKKSSFPNLNNFLFKKELPRPEGYTNKYNKTDVDHVRKIGFKKGESNWSRQNRKGKVLSLHERKGLRWNGGDWVEWDKEEMKHTKNKIINALIVNNNVRKKAAEYLNIGRTKLYKLMCRCETKQWWDETYPMPKQTPPRVSREQRSEAQKRVMAERKAKGIKAFARSREDIEEKRLANMKKAIQDKAEAHRKSLIPKIKEALSNNNNGRTAAARSIGVKPATFKAWMVKTKKWVDWSVEYPVKNN